MNVLIVSVLASLVGATTSFNINTKPTLTIDSCVKNASSGDPGYITEFKCNAQQQVTADGNLEFSITKEGANVTFEAAVADNNFANNVFTKTKKTKLSAADYGKYTCKVQNSTDQSPDSLAVNLQAQECSGEASSVVKSVALTTGCLVVTLLKLSY